MDRRVGYPGLDFGYGGTLVLCAAVYGVLWSHRLTALWIVAVLGFCFGAVTWLVDIALMVGVFIEESGVATLSWPSSVTLSDCRIFSRRARSGRS